MQDIAPFFNIVIVIAAVVTPAVVLVRLVRGGESGSLATLFVAPDHNAWPRGKQVRQRALLATADESHEHEGRGDHGGDHDHDVEQGGDVLHVSWLRRPRTSRR